MGRKNLDLSLYVITDRRTAGKRSLVDIVRAAIKGGAALIQLREKEATTLEMVELGMMLHAVTREAGIPLIVNDRIDVALAVDAEGVHVGQHDMPASIARGLIGQDRILGVSAETVEDALRAEHEGADYLGVGDIFGTPSKADAGAPIGIEGLVKVVKAVSIPVVGIGGITQENAEAVIRAGAVGVSVISAVIGAPDPEEAARGLRDRVIPELFKQKGGDDE